MAFKRRNPRGKRGMTLVETLIYAALLVILLASIVQAVLLLTTHYRAVRNTRDIEDSAIAVLDRLVREARNADEISASSTPSGTNPSILALTVRDSATGNSTTTQFSVSDGRMVLHVNDVYQGPLTKGSVIVLGFQINQIVTSRSTALRVQLSLQSDQATPAVITKNFYDTVVLRGSY